MTKLLWDQVGQRLYETGISKGILFTQKIDGTYNTGVPWNGLVSVSKSPDGGEENAIYADNMKYLSLTSAENLKGSISAYTYPDDFEACDGSSEVKPGLFIGQQNRTPFALAYVTIVGNDTQGNAYGEKLHVIYNAKVSPSERTYESVNEDPNAITFSWDFTTTPVDAGSTLLPSAGVVIDKTQIGTTAWNAILDKVQGAAANDATLPTIAELITLATPSGTAEVASLNVTAAATTAGNVTVTLNGVATNVALTTGDNTAAVVATRIRAAAFAGWTTGGTGTVVTFTSNTTGSKTDAIYSAGTTGAAGTMTTTTQGA